MLTDRGDGFLGLRTCAAPDPHVLSVCTFAHRFYLKGGAFALNGRLYFPTWWCDCFLVCLVYFIMTTIAIIISMRKLYGMIILYYF